VYERETEVKGISTNNYRANKASVSVNAKNGMENENEGMKKIAIACQKCDRVVFDVDRQYLTSGNLVIWSSLVGVKVFCICGRKFGGRTGWFPSDENLPVTTTRAKSHIIKTTLDALAEDDDDENLPLSKSQVDKQERNKNFKKKIN
jgi:hypothetical protein